MIDKKLTKKQLRQVSLLNDSYDNAKRGIYKSFYSSPNQLSPKANEDLAYAMWQLGEQRNHTMREIIYGGKHDTK